MKVDLKFFKNKKILITGGTGLIGKSLVEILLNSKAKVYVVSLDKLKTPKKVKKIFGDLTDFNFCKKITKNVDYVFHLAGIKASLKVTLKRPSTFFVPLLMMNTNLLEACKLNKVKRLVYTSSIGAYSKKDIFKESNIDECDYPMDLYPGWAKRMAELQIQSYKTEFKLNNYFIVRPCNVYGPGDNFDEESAMFIPSIISKAFKNLNKKKVEIWGDGKAIRDFAFSKDIAMGIVLTMIKGTGKHKYLNLGGGKAYKISDAVKIMSKVIGFKYFFNKDKKASGYSKRVMSIKNAKKIIKYKPNYNLEKGVRETWEWFIKNKSKNLNRYNYFKTK